MAGYIIGIPTLIFAVCFYLWFFKVLGRGVDMYLDSKREQREYRNYWNGVRRAQLAETRAANEHLGRLVAQPREGDDLADIPDVAERDRVWTGQFLGESWERRN